MCNHAVLIKVLQLLQGRKRQWITAIPCVCRFLLDAEIEEVSANLKTLLKELPVRPFMLCDNFCSGSQFCLILPDTCGRKTVESACCVSTVW